LSNKMIGTDANKTYPWRRSIYSDKMYSNPANWTDADLREASKL